MGVVVAKAQCVGQWHNKGGIQQWDTIITNKTTHNTPSLGEQNTTLKHVTRRKRQQVMLLVAAVALRLARCWRKVWAVVRQRRSPAVALVPGSSNAKRAKAVLGNVHGVVGVGWAAGSAPASSEVGSARSSKATFLKRKKRACQQCAVHVRARRRNNDRMVEGIQVMTSVMKAITMLQRVDHNNSTIQPPESVVMHGALCQGTAGRKPAVAQRYKGTCSKGRQA